MLAYRPDHVDWLGIYSSFPQLQFRLSLEKAPHELQRRSDSPHGITRPNRTASEIDCFHRSVQAGDECPAKATADGITPGGACSKISVVVFKISRNVPALGGRSICPACNPMNGEPASCKRFNSSGVI